MKTSHNCYVSDDIDVIYKDICLDLLDSKKVGNTRELNNVLITLTNVENNIVSIRNLSEKYLFGELIWYFTGRNDLDFISKFSSFWENISDDGKTCNSAYGNLIGGKYGFNQINTILKLLTSDPDSRRAVININVPNEHVDTTKDEPCTICLQFLIRDGKLDCTAMMRSNDVWFGFPYDVAFFTVLQKYIADLLNIKCGQYTHFATSFHLYERDEDKICNILENPVPKKIRFNSEKLINASGFLANEIDYCDKKSAGDTLLSYLDKLDIYHKEGATENGC